ncbi:MAG: Maf-like protein [Microgenomates group bacterium GW2011_GWC1_37_8]|uniref:Maf-like protein n=1 Tax=Candidatus Woesebacteria bacterium GW2011_GWB1_38_8 TaxID=1618570 RepID=A0A0G0L147_9BACT|nr:MAG: Maf-like protein [Microgenomates group bacterium GW2011_GWC1_37_8]KKQ85663.1 MAG: Maf-like protein [Candidatus Woesebacteria bacterium GW2011_GWB1_38_8]
MKIGIIGSLQFSEKMLELQDKLKDMGHDAFLTHFAPSFVGKSDNEKEKIKINQKQNVDTVREFWELMQGADAILVVNYDKNDIKNYIGGGTLMEIGFAHILKQKIFLLNPIPDIPFYKTEIEAVKPIVLNGNLSLIK